MSDAERFKRARAKFQTLKPIHAALARLERVQNRGKLTDQRSRRLVGLEEAFWRRNRQNPARAASGRFKKTTKAAKRRANTIAARGGYVASAPRIDDDLRRMLIEAAPLGASRSARKTRTKRKGSHMAKKRSAKQRAATRKLIAFNRARKRKPYHGQGLAFSRSAKAHNKKFAAARRSKKTGRRRRRRGGGFGLTVIPSGRRRVTISARRFNPGGSIGEALKSVVSVGVPAVLAGGTFGLIDAKVLSKYSDPIRYGGKAAYALLLGILFRKNPILSAATMGGVLGSFGSDLAAKLGGGTPAAPTTTAAVQGIGALLREDTQAMGLLIQEMRGMGLNVDSNVSLGSVGVGDDLSTFDDVNLG